jgi:AcrR family transcriptional regulator
MSYHHSDLRNALVEEGIAILERDGLDALTVRAAARAVGVSHAAPARHFPHASGFLAAIAAVGFRRLAAALAEPRVEQAADEFQAAGLAYVGFAIAHPDWYRLLFHPVLPDHRDHPELESASAEAFEQLRAHVRRAIAAGTVRDDDVDTLSLTAWATVHGIATLIIDGQLARKGYGQDGEDLAVLVTQTLYLGLHA